MLRKIVVCVAVVVMAVGTARTVQAEPAQLPDGVVAVVEVGDLTELDTKLAEAAPARDRDTLEDQ